MLNLPSDLRLQLLEPEKYPYLYKCLYGVLMLLPQSSAFAALKNRLNSVSNIGYLHGPPRRYDILSPPVCYSEEAARLILPHSAAQTGPPQYDRPSGSRLKPRDENSIRWVELLDKFKFVQERARRAQASQRQSLDANDSLHNPSLTAALSAATIDRTKDRSGIPDLPRNIAGGSGAMGPVVGGAGLGVAGNGGGSRGAGEPKISSSSSLLGSGHKHKSSLPNLGRLGIGSRKSKK